MELFYNLEFPSKDYFGFWQIQLEMQTERKLSQHWGTYPDWKVKFLILKIFFNPKPVKLSFLLNLQKKVLFVKWFSF